MTDTVWKHLDDSKFGLMRGLSTHLLQLANNKPDSLPNIRNGPSIVVTSDYSGHHTTAEFEVISIFLSNLNNFSDWDYKRRILREKFLTKNRRMSFKDLHDKQRQKALLPFLLATNTISGLVATIAVHRTIKSMFSKKGRINLSEPVLQQYNHWNPKTFERLLRVLHFVSFFVSGLSNPGQNMLWFTDEDEIAPNDERVKEVTYIWGRILSHYLSHSLGHIRFGTTNRCDDGSRQIEDLASIPDLVAGAASEFFSASYKDGQLIAQDLWTPAVSAISAKTRQIATWLANEEKPLKRLFLLLSPSKSNTNKLNIKWLDFNIFSIYPGLILPLRYPTR